MNKENLLKLAAYLESLPEDYDKFDMAAFARQDGCGYLLPSQAREIPCGTHCCALGHGPAAGVESPIPVPTVIVDDNMAISRGWSNYSTMAMGVSPTADRMLWCWMFGEDWACIDGENDHFAAARRIRVAVANPEADFEELNQEYGVHI